MTVLLWHRNVAQTWGKEIFIGKPIGKWGKISFTIQAKLREMLTKYYSGDQIEKEKWAGHVAHTEEKKINTGFWLRILNEKDSSEDYGLDGG